MTSLRLNFIVLLTLSFLASTNTFAHIPVSKIYTQNSLAPMLKRVTPAIVNISVEKVVERKLSQILSIPDNDKRKVKIKTMMVGSGIIFDANKGYIVTNAHVVKDQKVIVVTLKNGLKYYAKLLAKSKDYDIAILQIHAKHLTQLSFGNSNELSVGDFVAAIGSPFGLSQTVTSGVISALNRSHPQIEGYQSFIQTDAPINPGNSGGALITLQGKLVGINTAIVAPTAGNTGIGFAIPSNMAKQVVQQLLKYGKVERGALGVIVQNLSPALATAINLPKQQGAIVSEVLPNSPAADAGLKAGDVITKLGHLSIESADQLKNTLGLIRPDTTINITVIRDHQDQVIQATIGDPKHIKTRVMAYFSGIRMRNFTELESNGTKLSGVVIASISDKSPGALAGLEPGDVITKINNQKISSLKQLNQAITGHKNPLLLTVARGNIKAFMVIRAH